MKITADTATDTVDAGTGLMRFVNLLGAGNAATAIWRTGGSGGAIIVALGVAAGVSDSATIPVGVPYSNLHVTVTGTTPMVQTGHEPNS